ncbi:hypothetical protein BJX99DRAFT_258193 [Aspergillus californicus]
MSDFMLHMGINKPIDDDHVAHWVIILVYPDGQKSTWYSVVGGPQDHTEYAREKKENQDFTQKETDFETTQELGPLPAANLERFDKKFMSKHTHLQANQAFAITFLGRCFQAGIIAHDNSSRRNLVDVTLSKLEIKDFLNSHKHRWSDEYNTFYFEPTDSESEEDLETKDNNQPLQKTGEAKEQEK